MEFPFDINNLFGDEITVVDSRLQPSSSYRLGLAESKERMRRVIDAMGSASTKAQGLYRIITDAKKLETSLNHQLYVMKEAAANNGRGAIVGILKVGKKTLFVYDHNGQQHEMLPLCILDFYVHESRQRKGCGRRLFDFMLQNENVLPHHIAIDNPSTKFLPFLAKHYNLKAVIPQVNKFVVFEGFFRSRSDVVRQQGRIVNKPPTHPSSARNRAKRMSWANDDPMRTQREKEALSLVNLPRSRSRDALNTVGTTPPPPPQETPYQTQPLPSNDRRNLAPLFGDDFYDTNSSRGRGAQAQMYSRHVLNPSPFRQNGGDSYRENHVEPLYRKVPTPPPIRRDGPSPDFREFHRRLNGHQQYQDSRGHLRSDSAPTSQQSSPSHVQNIPGSSRSDRGNKRDPYVQTAKPVTLNSNWNIYGVPPSCERKWQHTKLW